MSDKSDSHIVKNRLSVVRAVVIEAGDRFAEPGKIKVRIVSNGKYKGRVLLINVKRWNWKFIHPVWLHDDGSTTMAHIRKFDVKVDVEKNDEDVVVNMTLIECITCDKLLFQENGKR